MPNRQRLSHFAIKNLKPRERPFTIWDVTQRGLAIVVQPSGHAAWKTVYSHHGRPRWIHLADATAIGLADARKLANEIMYQVAQGKDPAAERRAEAQPRHLRRTGKSLPEIFRTKKQVVEAAR
jgi:hypothetical protein